MKVVASCYDCGLEYGGPAWIEVVVPDSVWDLIRPDGAEGSGGLLCITCISRRINEAGMKDVPVFLCGMEPIRPIVCDEDVKEAVIRNWKPEQESEE